MGATLTTVLPMLREHYHNNITDIFFTTDKAIAPLMAALESKSMDDGMGRGYVVPIEYGMGSSVSAAFDVAQGISQGTDAGNAALRDRWVVPATTINATAQWTRESMLAAQGKGADEMFDVMQRETDAKIGRIRQRIGQCVAEAGWGRIGVLTAISGTTITLDPSACNRISVGDRIVATAAEATGVLLNPTAGKHTRITAINPDNGQCTTADDMSSGGTPWTSTSVVYFYGDRQDAASPSQLVPAGLRGWLPKVAPSGGASWMNIVRDGVPELCGHRIDATGYDHATALIRGVNRMFKYGSKVDIVYVSAEDYAILSADKDQTKIVSVDVGKYKIAFDGVSISTLAGNVPVVPDAMLLQGEAYMGPFGDKKFAPFLAHNGDLVNIDNIDGNEIRALASSTAFEMRLYFRGAIILPAPGKFGVVHSLSSS